MVPVSQLRARFALALAEMYGREVPAYRDLVDVSVAVNAAYREAHPETAELLGSTARVTAERHGAIRVGSAAELHLVARLFALFGMHPVGFYDLREATGGTAVPVISTAFRPVDRAELAENPFRVFTSMLVTDDRRFFADGALQSQVERAISAREMFPRELVERIARAEAAGGVPHGEADDFIRLATQSFAVPAHAVDKGLYDALCAISPVAADIYFGLNINHLTPRVLDIDTVEEQMERARGIAMKDRIEGPPRREGIEVLLRQTSFKSLPEPILFRLPDGRVERGTRRVRFGEIEQRGVALTPAGRSAYDDALAAWEAEWAVDSSGDYQTRWAGRFDRVFPRDSAELERRGWGCFTYHATELGRRTNPRRLGDLAVAELVGGGYLRREPIVYEDFLPKSAAGIFNSNLADRGSRDDEARGSSKGIDTLSEIVGTDVLDPFVLYQAESEASLRQASEVLGVTVARLGNSS